MRRLLTLGGLTLERFAPDESGPRLRTRLAILAVLAAAGRRGIRRERLTALLWPDSDDDRARNALRQSLFALRRELQVDDLTVGTNDLRLNPAVITSDVEEFEAAIAHDRLEEAIAVYGGPFLEGVVLRAGPEFEHWVDEQRLRLAGEYEEALETLAAGATTAANLSAAAEWWRRRAAADPLSSRVARDYMLALDAAGDPERAIRHAAEHAAVLQETLGVAVDPSVRQIAERIAAELRSRPDAAPLPEIEVVARPQPALSSGRRIGVSGWIAAALVVAFLGWRLAWPRAGEEGGVVRFALAFSPNAPFQNGIGATFAISPDGKALVYRGLDGTTTRLFLRTFDQMAAHSLPGTEGADQPRFSPDGKWVAFIANDKLRKVSVAGGEPTTLAAFAQVLGLSWGANGEIVVSTQGSLVGIAENGGPLRFIAAPDTGHGEIAKRWPLVLDDGRTILFTSWRRDPDSARIGMVAVPTGETRYPDLLGTAPLRVLDGTLIYAGMHEELLAVRYDPDRPAVIGTPVRVVDHVEVGGGGGAKAAISRTGALLYLGLGSSQLTLVDSAGASRPLLRQRGRYSYPRYSPDGRRVAFTVTSSRATDIWVLDVASGTTLPLTDDGVSDRAEWSPDGRRVLYQSGRPSQSGLYWRAADASSPADALVVTGQEIFEGMMGADGRSVVYRTRGQASTIDSIWRIDRNGTAAGKPEFIAAGRVPRISPDGRWLAYESRATGVSEVFVARLPHGLPILVSDSEGHQPVWSRDSRQLYYGVGGQLLAATLAADGSGRITARDAVLKSGIILLSGVHAVYDVAPAPATFLLEGALDGGSLMVVRGWGSELRRIGAGH